MIPIRILLVTSIICEQSFHGTCSGLHKVIPIRILLENTTSCHGNFVHRMRNCTKIKGCVCHVVVLARHCHRRFSTLPLHHTSCLTCLAPHHAVKPWHAIEALE
eukprot:COSAG01_NODE_2294_length_7967_cov_41.570539_14_plen_104_part_00